MVVYLSVYYNTQCKLFILSELSLEFTKSTFISTCMACEPVCTSEQRLHDLQCKTEQSL